MSLLDKMVAAGFQYRTTNRVGEIEFFRDFAESGDRAARLTVICSSNSMRFDQSPRPQRFVVTVQGVLDAVPGVEHQVDTFPECMRESIKFVMDLESDEG